MRSILALLVSFLLTAPSLAGTYFCHAPQYDADTRFDGEIGVEGAQGTLLYFGPNPMGSDNEGIYKFESSTRMKLYFAGEPVHTCDLFQPNSWNCRMGTMLRYRLTCDF